MFGFDWTGDESVDFVDDLITLSMFDALDDEASDGRRFLSEEKLRACFRCACQDKKRD